LVLYTGTAFVKELTMSMGNKKFELLPTVDTALLSEYLNGIGTTLGGYVVEHCMIGYGDPQPQGIHCETIYDEVMCRYFLLGCIEQSEEGGESLIFDGVQAATVILTEYPELADVTITYRADKNSTTDAVSPLVYPGPDDERFLCYRQMYVHDEVHGLPDSMTRTDFHDLVDGVIDRCMVFDQRLNVGQAVLVDNYKTLHGRRPYKGIRKMLRVRVYTPA
jgi:alpha-ketoglutarate-dependent taurine dioxygenase